VADDRARIERLWAPWRLEYVAAVDRPRDTSVAAADLLPGADRDCFLCRAAAGGDDRANLVVDRFSGTICLLNRFPYNNGHLLVAPARHRGGLDDLGDDEHLALIAAIRRATSALQQCMNPEGFNVGLNLGRVAGAGVPGHLHWHIVPRWNGDTNFMPVLAGARVIPQSLDAAWEMLSETRAESGPHEAS
jgi:ATP adenylyltransferase